MDNACEVVMDNGLVVMVVADGGCGVKKRSWICCYGDGHYVFVWGIS